MNDREHRFDELDILKFRSEREDKLIANLLSELDAFEHRGGDIKGSPMGYLIRDLAESRGFEVAGRVGDLIPFDPVFHVSAFPVRPGEMVRVDCPGMVCKRKGVTQPLNPVIVRTDINAPKWQAIDAERAEAKRKAEAAEAEKREKARADEASRWKRYD